MSLKILKVRDLIEDDRRFDMLNNKLLKPPFLLIINGSVRSGKSNLLMNFIYNDNFYHNKFDNVVFISPTVHIDKTLQHMQDDDDIITSNDMENLDDTISKIIEEQVKNPDEHSLIILDDCLGFIKRNSVLTHLATRYRHYKMSLIISCQDFRSIPNIIRPNASGYVVFKTPNQKEIDKIEYEFGSLFPTFAEFYQTATDKVYNFLFINLRTLQLYHNFENLLYSKEK